MNVKRYLAATLAVFVVSVALGYLVNGVLLQSTYASIHGVWRPDILSKMWINAVNDFILSFVFVYLFVKGYEGRGIMEGVRFGLLMGLIFAVPAAYGAYVIIPIPYYLALEWFLYGMAQTVIIGIVAAAIYKPAERPAA
jgi:hypothetical protein